MHNQRYSAIPPTYLRKEWFHVWDCVHRWFSFRAFFNRKVPEDGGYVSQVRIPIRSCLVSGCARFCTKLVAARSVESQGQFNTTTKLHQLILVGRLSEYLSLFPRRQRQGGFQPLSEIASPLISAHQCCKHPLCRNGPWFLSKQHLCPPSLHTRFSCAAALNQLEGHFSLIQIRRRGVGPSLPPPMIPPSSRGHSAASENSAVGSPTN